MSEADLTAICGRAIDKAAEYVRTDIAAARAKAYDYYWGKPFGNEQEGLSQTVTRDVQIYIDSLLPGLIKTFVASDSAVSFTPRGPEDTERAEQQTEIANYVFQTWNDGYQLTHDCLKDGALQKTGAFKWYWEPETKVSERLIQGLDDGQLQEFMQSPETEVIAHSEYQIQTPQGPITLHDVQVREKKEAGKIRICVVPPEELLLSPEGTSMYAEKNPCVGHVTTKTYSQLVEMGIDKAILEEVGGSSDTQEFDQEKIARQERNSSLSLGTQDGNSGDPARRVYRYYELYIEVDADGDGITERRLVCLLNRTKIVHNEVVDHVPLSWWSPKIMPHEPIGMSIADDLMDLQYVRSTIRRQAINNVYLTNIPRMYINEDADVNIDDALTIRPGGIIRGRRPGPEAMQPIVIPFTAQYAFQADEQLAQEGEQRTGISRFVQGLDPNSINKTATHASIVNQATQMRTELYARNFAEYAFKPMFKGIQYLLARHQTQALVMRLRGKSAAVEPDVWKTEYDMTCNVGLGTGNKDQQLMHLQALSQDVGMIAQSPFGFLIDETNVFNLFKKKSELAGFKDAAQFVKDPAQIDPQVIQQAKQPKPPPEIQKAQMQIEADKQQAQADGQMEQQKIAQEGQQKAQEAQQQLMLEKVKAELQMELERYKAELKAQVDYAVGMANAHARSQQEIVNGRPY